MSSSLVIPFVNVTINHAFYRQGQMPDLSIFPLAETRTLLRKMGLFFKSTASTFSLGYTKGKTEGHFEKTETLVHLVFAVKNGNPYFQNVTDIESYSPQKKVFLFSNLAHRQIKANNKFLTHKEKVSKADLVKLDSKKLNNRDITDLMIGHTMEHYFGLIHIALNKNVLRTQGTKKIIQWNYAIEFDNRKAFWRYFLISPKVKLKSLKVKGKTFQLDKPIQLMDGTKAWLIELPEKRPLLEYNADVLSADLTVGYLPEWPIKLPNPTASSIRSAKQGEETVMCADMYVYL